MHQSVESICYQAQGVKSAGEKLRTYITKVKGVRTYLTKIRSWLFAASVIPTSTTIQRGQEKKDI